MENPYAQKQVSRAISDRMKSKTVLENSLFGRVWSGPLQAPRSMLVAAALFAGATAGAWLAASHDRPTSSALFYVLGVMSIGAATGLRLGVVAAILASLIYNVFLRAPVLQFSLDSADEYIPLVAFNLSALLSGGLAGRLNDRARAAEQATARLHLLLEISGKLQEAVQPEEVGQALSDFCRSASLGRAEVFGIENGELLPTIAAPEAAEVARHAFETSRFGSVAPGLLVKPLTTFRGAVGLLVHEAAPGRPQAAVDWAAIAVLLTIAMERCLLLRERAETEALQRSEELKTALISSVSHDLRSPLAAITASATSLLAYGDTLQAEDRRSMLQIIRDQSERLNRFTSNLLSLGKLHSELGAQDLEEVDVVELVGTAVAAARDSVRAGRPIEKRINVPSAIVRGNAVMIEQVFINVIDNALKYSAAGAPVRVELDVSASDVEIAISDEGPGIPSEELERIFERFFRSSTSGGVDGQGLGLSIARGFAERFGGSIAAHSPAGPAGGTRVRIRFPLAPQKRERPA